MRCSYLALSTLVFIVLSVAACSTQPEKPSIDADLRQERLEQLSSFSFNGGLGIWTDEQSISARIVWQQDGEELNVQLSGPLGIGNMKLVGGSTQATLSRSGTAVAEGSSINAVVQQGLGLTAPIPVTQLQQWVRGLPGNAGSVVRDMHGKLSSLGFVDEQGTSWQARFKRYLEVDGIELPSLITASGGPYSVRLVLKDWQPSVTTLIPEPDGINRRLAIPTR